MLVFFCCFVLHSPLEVWPTSTSGFHRLRLWEGWRRGGCTGSVRDQVMLRQWVHYIFFWWFDISGSIFGLEFFIGLALNSRIRWALIAEQTLIQGDTSIKSYIYSAANAWVASMQFDTNSHTSSSWLTKAHQSWVANTEPLFSGRAGAAMSGPGFAGRKLSTGIHHQACWHLRYGSLNSPRRETWTSSPFQSWPGNPDLGAMSWTVLVRVPDLHPILRLLTPGRRLQRKTHSFRYPQPQHVHNFHSYSGCCPASCFPEIWNVFPLNKNPKQSFSWITLG